MNICIFNNKRKRNLGKIIELRMRGNVIKIFKGGFLGIVLFLEI